MRELVLMRGVQGSGKSTFIEEHGLENYTLSSDKFRMLIQSPELTVNGSGFGITMRNDKIAWKMLFECLEERMKRGEYTVIDATHSRSDMISQYKKLAEKYRYRVTVVDFSDVPLEKCLERNKERDKYKFVPEEAIHRVHSRIVNGSIPSWVRVVKPKDFEETLLTLDRPLDLNSRYNHVVYIGDIHGCYDVLMKAIPELQDDTMYIFTGDYIDRGIQNKEVVEYLIGIKDKENVVLLEGNHERWLRYYANDELDSIKSKEFKNNTAKQLNGINKKELRQLCRKFHQVSYITFDGNDIVATHGGIPFTPYCISFISSDQLINGVGNYNDDIDSVFNENAKSGSTIFTIFKEYQVHGHRNTYDFDNPNGTRSFNLEGSVEVGGHLRMVTFSKGEKPLYQAFKNETYNKERFDVVEQIESSEENDVMVFVEELRKSPYVKETKINEYISSFNFNQKAFYQKKIKGIVSKARGLFIDLKNGKVLARGFEKFFNLNEKRETEPYNLFKNLKQPLEIMYKENGYLGIVSYDHEADELFFASKSSSKTEFAQWFKDFYYEKHDVELLKNYLKTSGTTLLFEVILNKDPHIVDYEKEEMVILLGEVKNQLQFEKTDYEHLCKLSHLLKINVVVKSEYTLNQSDYNEFLKDLDVLKSKFNLEGFVICDSENFFFKVKTDHYNTWKKLRGVKEQIQNGKAVDEKKLHTPLENEVYNFMKKMDKEELRSKSIVDVRREHMFNFVLEELVEKNK